MTPSPPRAFGSLLHRILIGPDYPPWVLAGRWRVPAWTGAVVLAGAIVVTAHDLTYSWRLPASIAWLLAVLSLAPVALVAHRALTAWRIWLAGFVIGLGVSLWQSVLPWNVVQLPVGALVLGILIVRAERAVLAGVAALTLLPPLVVGVATGADWWGEVLLAGALIAVAEQLWHARWMQRALAAQTRVSEEASAQRVMLEERTRIAREMHDVVAHHMSMIAVRAETAPYRLAGLTDDVAGEFAGLAGTARAALNDMRRLLGVLRSGPGLPELAPQPGLEALGELVDTARGAGMKLHFLPPDPAAVARAPEAVGLAGYRVVQEALANAARHAPGAPVTIQVSPGSHDLAVRIDNPPPPQGAAPASGEGHGLIGMRERAMLLGGQFSAAPTADGGYAVEVSLPYDHVSGADREREKR